MRLRNAPLSAEFTFTAEGDSIEPSDFGDALIKCQRLLERVDEIHSLDNRRTIRWKMGKLIPGSIGAPLTGVQRSADISPNLEVPRHCVRIVRAVADGVTPTSHRELKVIERISEFRGTIQNGVTGYRLDAPETNDQARITQAVIEIAERILARSDTVAAIEGRIEAVNIHNRLRFTVYDSVTGAGTRCFFRPEMLDEVLQTIGAKVLVAGTLRRDFDGRPREIRDIVEFRQIGRSSSFPSVLKLEGAYSDIEGDTLQRLAEIRGE